MRKYCLILGILFLLSFKKKDGISGEYRVVLDSEFEIYQKSTCYMISIRENNYTKKYLDGENVEGGITIAEGQNSKKIYYLQDFLFNAQNKVQKARLEFPKLGKVIMEVEEISSDTLSFRTTFNSQLNASVNTGKLVREK